MSPPDELKQIAEQVQRGAGIPMSVRNLLAIYNYQRRGSWIVDRIRRDLASLNVTTSPDFESLYIDARFLFVKRQEKPSPDKSKSKDAIPTKDSADMPSPTAEVAPSHRISRLKAANTAPVTVAPTDSFEKAVTLMFTNDYSQLPVTTTPTEVKGMISWRSIGHRVAMKCSYAQVRDCMEPHREVKSTASMFDVIREVSLHDCVLVRDEKRQITGIVTAADISEQFRTLAEPFLLLGDIESDLRRLIESSFPLEVIKAARDDTDNEREIKSAADLSFGEYLRLLENPDNWSTLDLALDRQVFVKDLDQIRVIRNDVMHFDPDGITDEQLSHLRRFARFLEQVLRLKSQ